MQISFEQIAKEILRQRNLKNNKKCGFFVSENGAHKYVTLIKTFTFNPIWNRMFYLGMKEFWYKDQMEGNQVCPDNAMIFMNLCPASNSPLILGYLNGSEYVTMHKGYMQENCIYIEDVDDSIHTNFSRCAGYCASCGEENAEEKSNCPSPVIGGLGWIDDVIRKNG